MRIYLFKKVGLDGILIGIYLLLWQFPGIWTAVASKLELHSGCIQLFPWRSS